MKKIFGILLILMSLCISTSFAQDVRFTASAKNIVQTGENFYLKYELNEKASNFEIPNFGDFQVLTGPSQSSSSSTQIINGNVSHSYSFSYTYVLKAPNKEGKYELGSATAIVKGKQYKSNAVIIQVVKSNANNTTQNPRQSQTSQSNANSAGSNFVRLNLNKTSAYQGEAIYGSFKMYLSSRNLAGFQDIKFPDYNGFWAEDVNNPNQIQLTLENYNGRNYYTAELKSIVLYPQRSGELSISDGNFDVIIQERVSGGSSGSPFDSFFGRYQNVPYSLKSPEIKLNIKPLPGNKPASFSGAVGDFSVTSSISHDSIDVNDAFTIKVRMQGTGNFNLIDAPKLNLPKEFEVYDPEISRNLSQTANGSSGSIEWLYTIIPRYPELYVLKPIEISWFNPKTASYNTYKGKEERIYVNRTADFKENEAIAKDYSNSDLNVLGNDIRYIMDIPENQKKSIVSTPFFWFAYLLPTLAFILIVILRRKQIKERSNIAKMRNKKANKVAKKRLKTAKQLMTNDSKEFYNEIIKALWGYVADKLDMDIANLSRDNVSERLTEENLSDDLIKKLLYIIDTCEYAHFAPSSEDTDPKRIYQYTAGLISKLEQNL